jgi:hypothetical protein
VATDSHVIVTDRRIVFSLHLYEAETIPSETREAMAFDEITAWKLGRLHDERPLLRLRHAPRERVEWKPAHRFLMFQWGNASAPVQRRESTLPFNRPKDRTLGAIISRLEADGIPRGSDFAVERQGTREERGGYAVLYTRP